MIYSYTNSQHTDEFNLSNKRNVRNTPRRTYNCGGSSEIEVMWKEEIFDKWCNRYDGPIIMFAKKFPAK